MTQAPLPGAYPPDGYGVPAGLPRQAYTPWFTRVLAWIVDYLPVALLTGIGYAIVAATRECVDVGDGYGDDLDATQVCTATTSGYVGLYAMAALAFAFVVWNYGYRQGTTGSSVGKSITGFQVVGERTGRPIGFGPSVLRQLAHVVDGLICYIGYLFPLWDAKRQTLADKIMTTVCVPLQVHPNNHQERRT